MTRTDTLHVLGRARLLAVAAIALAMCPMAALAGDWLARVADDRMVCRLSIPGTHDAATGEGWDCADSLAANLIARTQELTLAQQWAAGIRAFDLRPDVRTDSLGRQTLHIYHGEFATRASMASVMGMLRDSLAAHPSEFAIIVMRHEASASRESARWKDMTDYVLAKNRDLLVDFRPDITVGQLRGRILVLSRDVYNDSMPRGGYIEGWRHDAECDWTRPATVRGSSRNGHLVVQDFYDMSGEGGMPTKLGAIERLFRLTGKGEVLRADPHTWFINHTSGYLYTTQQFGGEPVSTTEGYRANAAETNRWMANLIEAKRSRGRSATTGIVMMDFGGADRSGGQEVLGRRLVNTIIDSNW